MTFKKSSPKNKTSSDSGERIFRAVFEKHAAVMLLIEPQTGNILDANQAASDFYGYPKSKLCGMSISEINTLPPEQVAAARQKALSGEQNYLIFPHLLANGETRIVEVHSSPIALQKKPVLFSIVHDITERKQAEDALRASDSGFRALFDQMAVGVARIQTQTGKFVQVNQKDCDILGYSREEMEALDFQSITHPDDLQPDLENMALLKSGAIREYTMEKRLIHKNGSIVWVALTVSPMWQSGAQPDFHIAIVQDITARKQAEAAAKENEEQYRTLIEWSPEAIAVNQDGKLVYLNPAAIKTLGATSMQELAGKSALDLIHPDFHQMVLARIKDLNAVPLAEMKFLKIDGTTIDVESHAMTIVYNGKPARIVAFHDITDRKRVDIELQRYKENLELKNTELAQSRTELQIALHQYSDLYDFAPVGYFTLSRDGTILQANLAGARLLGVEYEKLLKQKIGSFVFADSVPAFVSFFNNLLKNHGKEICEIEFLKDGNKSVWVSIDASAFEGGNESRAVMIDVSARKQGEADLKYANEKLEAANLKLQSAFEHERYLAHTDALTGVNNRRYLFERAEYEFDIARRYQQPLSIIMFDLDHFKQVNDTFGHAAGDQMLEHVVQAARSQLRDVDLIGRYGGEEFVIVLPVTSAQNAYMLAERIRISAAAVNIKTEKGVAAVTLSIGIAEIKHAPQGDTTDDLIHRADEAMYAAKQAGRNRTVIFAQEKNTFI